MLSFSAGVKDKPKISDAPSIELGVISPEFRPSVNPSNKQDTAPRSIIAAEESVFFDSIE